MLWKYTTPDNISKSKLKSSRVYFMFHITLKCVNVSGVLWVNSCWQQTDVPQVVFLQYQEFIIFLLFIHLQDCSVWLLLIIRGISSSNHSKWPREHAIRVLNSTLWPPNFQKGKCAAQLLCIVKESVTLEAARKDNQASKIQPVKDLVSILRGKSMISAGSRGSNKDVNELIMRGQRVKGRNWSCKPGITSSKPLQLQLWTGVNLFKQNKNIRVQGLKTRQTGTTDGKIAKQWRSRYWDTETIEKRLRHNWGQHSRTNVLIKTSRQLLIVPSWGRTEVLLIAPDQPWPSANSNLSLIWGYFTANINAKYCIWFHPKPQTTKIIWEVFQTNKLHFFLWKWITQTV